MSNDDRLRLVDLRKAYGATSALDLTGTEALAFRSGEIHALAGENGAGKSTLVKTVCGLVRPTAGSMLLDGEPYDPQGVPEARAAGVEIVLQEPGLVPGLTVAENLFLGREALFRRLGVIDGKKRNRLAAEALGRVGESIGPNALAAELDLETQKFVELARALAFSPRVLVIDEMSASLTSQGVSRMSRVLREAAASGTLILYISHYLEETFDLCQRVTVLKDGRHVATRTTAGLSEEELQTLMVGRSLRNEMYHEELRQRQPAAALAPTLEIRDLAIVGSVEDFTVRINPGEIVGLGGLVGCGNEQVAEAVFGVRRVESGEMVLEGRSHRPKSTRQAIDAGIGLVTGDREKNDLLLDLPLRENMSLPTLPWRTRLGFIPKRRETASAASLIERLSIACRGANDLPANLSGGNRQKVALGKWLTENFKLLILQNPTRGVDVGAKSLIYKTVREIAATGTAVLLISDELNELQGMSDRIIIMRRGAISGTFEEQHKPTEEELVACMV